MPEETDSGAGADTTDAAPLQMAVALDGDSSCIAQARRAAARFLAEARERHRIEVAPRTVEDTQVIVSELVTNVVKYAPGPALLQLRVSGDSVHVEVWDSDPTLPSARSPDPQRIGQHGLEIVNILARSLAMRPTVVGKCITAALDLVPAGNGSA
ncbi:ATP-binding protein [Streptomyces sp. NPDC102406]|uniref:ATP-binding protein n=1 Tax=Streptomyces sp. NPDC102406 TaxID=3366171 RepID=UPI00382E1B7C